MFDVEKAEVYRASVEDRAAKVRLRVGPPRNTRILKKPHQMFGLDIKRRLAGLSISEHTEVRPASSHR